MDRVLAERGLARRVAMTVPHFQAVAVAAVEAGLLGSLPIHFARSVAETLALEASTSRRTTRRFSTSSCSGIAASTQTQRMSGFVSISSARSILARFGWEAFLA